MILKSLAFIAVLAATASQSMAACKTSDASGTWKVLGGTECVATITSAGKVSGSCGSGRVSVSSSCKVTGTIAGNSLIGRIDSEGNMFVGEFDSDATIAYRR